MNLEIVNQYFTNQNPWNYIWNRHSEMPNSCTKIKERSNFQVPFLHLHWNHGEKTCRGIQLGNPSSPSRWDPTIVTAHKFNSSPLKMGAFPKGNDRLRLPNHQFSGAFAVKFRGCISRGRNNSTEKGGRFWGHSHGPKSSQQWRKVFGW